MADMRFNWPALAWDGLDLLMAEAVAEAQTWSYTIVAHASDASFLVATGATDEGPCIARLPPDCRHVDICVLDSDGTATVISTELDELLLEGVVDPDLADLQRTLVSRSESTDHISISWLEPADTTEPAAVAVGLFLPMADQGSERRCRIGPLRDPGAAFRQIDASAHVDGPSSSLLVRLSSSKDTFVDPLPILAAHMPAAAARMRKELQWVDPQVISGIETALDALAMQMALPHDQRDATGLDATGLDGPAGFRRGFRILQPVRSAEDADERIVVPHWSAEDDLILFATRGQKLSWASDATAATGTRLTLTQDDGEIRATVFTRPYRPATSTALATLGATQGGGVTSYFGSAVADGHLTRSAEDLVEAVWARKRGQHPSGSASLLARHCPDSQGITPFSIDGISPAIAALGATHGLGRGLLEELDGLPVHSRIACLFWFKVAPTLAVKAAVARIELPLPDRATPKLSSPEHIAELIRWYSEPQLEQRLNALAARLSAKAEGEERRQGLSLLRKVGLAIGSDWLDLSDVAAAAELALAHPTEEQLEDAGSPWLELLSRLRANDTAQALAREKANQADLASLAEWRAQLPQSAVAAGHAPILAEDLALRLPRLSPVDTLLLLGHFQDERDQKQFIALMGEAIAEVDAASGAVGFANRVDRSGDIFVGMTRIAASSEAALTELMRLPATHKALMALKGWLDIKVPKPPASQRVASQMSRSMQIYSCYHLYMDILGECDAALDNQREPSRHAHSGLSALHSRLRSGVTDTLAQYLNAASRIAGDDFAFGLAFVERLNATGRPAGHAQAGVV